MTAVLNGKPRGLQRRSSRREETKIAQGEPLGKRSTEGFPPRRGGVKVQHIPGFRSPRRERSIRPYGANISLFTSYPGLRYACPGLFSIAPYGSRPMDCSWGGRCGGPFRIAGSMGSWWRYSGWAALHDGGIPSPKIRTWGTRRSPVPKGEGGGTLILIWKDHRDRGRLAG
jgi:hypothetical protein